MGERLLHLGLSLPSHSCPGKAALTRSMPSPFKDEHSVLMMVGHGMEWWLARVTMRLFHLSG